MFRRLAEAFEDNGSQGHTGYINNQQTYFNSLPNMILSPSSGLKGFDVAIQSVDTAGNQLQAPAIKNPNNIFVQDASPELSALAKQCATSSIDQLLAIKNPNADIGCGWLYTPPNTNSPYPKLSQGAIGDAKGPLPNFANPDYKKWFFDLQLAKKQILMDKCKALKGCADVDSDTYQGVCGYCTDTNQGVPIDNVGKPLYAGDSLGSCNPQSIVTEGINCPVPSSSGDGPQPIVDRTCDPVNGRLTSACLYNTVLAGGCSDNGSLALALSTAAAPDNYIANLAKGDAVKIYNRVANPPMKMDVFNSGATTVDMVLQETRRIAGNATQAANTALGAAARDLCLQKGAIDKFDFCSDISDGTLPPFNVVCLQKLFRKMGGQPVGSAYPSDSTMVSYNSMSNWGAVKQYLNQIVGNLSSKDYNVQRNAMIQFLGISPDKLIKRAPYTQGVEVFWFVANPGQPNQVGGFLKRTIEKDIVQFNSSGVVPQLAVTYPGFSEYSAMVQLFDVRTPANFTTKFQVTVDDGFWIAVNEPANIDKWALENGSSQDKIGFFSNMGIQGPTNYASNSCSNYYSDSPNITKIYYEDAGGGGHTFQFKANACVGNPTFTSPYYSLTLEPRAPFINFEVNKTGDGFEDTRNPGIFNQFVRSESLDFHNQTVERMSVPGKKGFVRFTNSRSWVNLGNIAYQSWGTVSFAFRLQSMPVKDAVFAFWVYNKFCVFYLQPLNGSTAQMYVQTSMTSDGKVKTAAMPFKISLNSWHYLEVAQIVGGFDVYCDTFDNIIKNGNFTAGNYYRIMNNSPITTTFNNGLYVQGKYSCNIAIGAKLSGTQFYSGGFEFDVAFVHFYDTYINAADVVRDCKCDWVFTDFPSALNKYDVLGNQS